MSEPLTKENWITTKWRMPRNSSRPEKKRYDSLILSVTDLETGEVTICNGKNAAKKVIGISSHQWITRCIDDGGVIKSRYTVKVVGKNE